MAGTFRELVEETKKVFEKTDMNTARQWKERFSKINRELEQSKVFIKFVNDLKGQDPDLRGAWRESVVILDQIIKNATEIRNKVK